ncbi:hypothetical protein [Candidatus Poriferisodalis sp.]|uniref:hypothetical protein n=1 Tax=Candidatus Poriferisodalis sp. TaxID=3101277 RepID=UPI003B51D034
MESWLPTGPADVTGLLADLTMLTVNGDWSPLTLEASRLVSEATSAGWADDRLVEALADVLAADARGELDEQPIEIPIPQESVIGSSIR